jgi:hypothetical protein
LECPQVELAEDRRVAVVEVEVGGGAALDALGRVGACEIELEIDAGLADERERDTDAPESVAQLLALAPLEIGSEPADVEKRLPRERKVLEAAISELDARPA